VFSPATNALASYHSFVGGTMHTHGTKAQAMPSMAWLVMARFMAAYTLTAAVRGVSGTQIRRARAATSGCPPRVRPS
jgi:hypothetical protein